MISNKQHILEFISDGFAFFFVSKHKDFKQKLN
jgi:hypothetical protein